MKTLKYKDREFLYEVIEHDCGDYGTFICYETQFYDATPITKTRKKWLLFGPLVEYTIYNKLFRLYCNVEDPGKSKKSIHELLDMQIDLLDRIDEINNGNIV